MTSSLTAVISPNGLGHFRRTVSILAALAAEVSLEDLTVVCERWQLERFRGDPALAALRDRVAFAHDVLEPGVRWSTDPVVYDDGRLLAWEQRLQGVEAVHTAGVVLSDNLVGVLTLRPDCILQGSFLMSDVLSAAYPTSTAVRTFVEHERALLRQWQPPMLCMQDIAMPGVLERTSPVPVPWMVPHVRPTLEDQHSPEAIIGVLGGATGVADDLLRRYSGALVSAGHRVVTTTALEGSSEGMSFSYDRVGFGALTIALVRPGLGTSTDCIRESVPLVTVHEGNVELQHNARRLAELGVAIDLGIAPDPAAVVQAIDDLVVDERRRNEMRARMRALEGGGLEATVRFLAARLSNTAVRGAGA